MRILHIAPENFAGVPGDYVKMHNQCGDYSRLITLFMKRNAQSAIYSNILKASEEKGDSSEICLNFYLPRNKWARQWREYKKENADIDGKNQPTDVNKRKVKSWLKKLESYYFLLTDLKKKRLIKQAIEEYLLDEFDIIHYDGGMDFVRNSEFARRWKKMGKKIVCCYYGSDLRQRGVFKELDQISDLNITSEFDHLSLKKDLNYLFYPYDTSELPERKISPDKASVTIVHSPTNRVFKGTDVIIAVIQKISKIRKINFRLLENLDRNEVLKIKSESDICIDQVGGRGGGTGYGKSGLETLGMGIPTITNMTIDYVNWFPENPFIVANNEQELEDRLLELIDNENYRSEIGGKGKQWVEKYHGLKSVNTNLYKLYKKYGLVSESSGGI